MGEVPAGPGTEKASLWREGVHTFRRNWEVWVSLASIFFFIFILYNGAASHYLEPLQAKLAVLESGKDDSLISAAVHQALPQLIGLFLVMLCISLVQRYLFLSFFLQKELPAVAVKPTGRNFFCFLAVAFQMAFVTVVPSTVALGVSMGLMAASRIIGVVGVVASVVLMAFLVMRFSLASALASGKIDRPMKSTWELTRGHCWRLFGNALAIVLPFLVLYIVLGVVQHALEHPLGTTGQTVVSSVFTAFGGVFISGVVSAYEAAVIRVLYGEKKMTDPNFVLTTRA